MSKPLTVADGWAIYALLFLTLTFYCCTIHTHIDTAVARVEAKVDALKGDPQ